MVGIPLAGNLRDAGACHAGNLRLTNALSCGYPAKELPIWLFKLLHACSIDGGKFQA